MGLSIKHAATEAKVRELATLRRQSMTRVVHDLAEEALKAERPRSDDAEVQARLERGLAYLERQRQWIAGRKFPTDKEMDALLYDEEGHPVR